MKIHILSFSFFLFSALFFTSISAEKHLVSSQAEFNTAISNAESKDTIAWGSGTYDNIYMNINKSQIVVMAEVPGETIFSGASRVFISGSYVTLHGLQFVGGNIGTNDVIKTTGSFNHFTHLNIQDYRSYKYLVINTECRYNIVSFCNFENRINLDDKNILSVLVDDTNPGYHKIQYCSFKNFDGTGGDLGIEPIRIGLSTQGEFISRTIVEYCYFTQCNGDGEIISNKARQNVFRYNTFEDNPKAELVLRHGDEGVVYGNFFLNGMGGVRVREGHRHVIYNNYFSGLSSRSIILQNDGSDPLDSITIAYNTFVNSALIRLGGVGSYKPKNVIFANNIFTQPRSALFGEPTNTETWIANILHGSLGITKPNGILEVDPKLEMNDYGFYELIMDSPAIDAAQSGYTILPDYPGLDIDNTILFDLMKQTRPGEISFKDIGCSESPHNVHVKPHVDASNTGPSYFWSVEKVQLNLKIEGQGAVEMDPASNLYPFGLDLELTAIPFTDYDFNSWLEDAISDQNPLILNMDRNKNITAKFIKENSTAVSEIENGDKIDIQLFPNPADEELTFVIQNKNKAWVLVELFDLSGRKIMSFLDQTIASGEFIFSQNISKLSSGIYLLYFSREEPYSKLKGFKQFKFFKT